MGVVRLRDVWGGECVFDDGSTVPIPPRVRVSVNPDLPRHWKVSRPFDRAPGVAGRACVLGVGQCKRDVLRAFGYLLKPFDPGRA